jgi:hypothetical protein
MFKSYLGRIEYDFQKSRVTGPWDHEVLVSAKKEHKDIKVFFVYIFGGLECVLATPFAYIAHL